MKKTDILGPLHSSFALGAGRLKTWTNERLTSHPKRIFYLMVFLLISSAVLCFTLRKSAAPAEKTAGTISGKAVGGIGEISQTAGNLSAVLAMQAELSGLLSQKVLSARDSLHIVEMMHRIKKLQTNITHHEKNQP